MRLRYLHLPQCGPLENVAVVFGQETLLYGPTAIVDDKRKGAINFVVGINGTGKSTILRALYLTFHALKNRQRPPLRVSLVWDVHSGNGGTKCALLDCSSLKGVDHCFALLDEPVAESLSAEEWQRLIQTSREGPSLKATGNDVPGDSALQAHLPRRLLAYTTGAETLWEQLEEPEFLRPDELLDEAAESFRTKGWEWSQERLRRAVNESAQASAEPSDSNDAEQVTPLRRVSHEELRLAAIALAIWQSGMEFHQSATFDEVEAMRLNMLHGHDPEAGLFNGARKVFNRVDWFRSTHVSLIYRLPDELADDMPTRKRAAQLYCLLALADKDAVIREPMNRVRIVLSLGAVTNGIYLSERLRKQGQDELPSREVAELVGRIDGSTSMAESILNTFSETAAGSIGLAEMFDSLCDWQAAGWLEDITLTIERLHRKPEGAMHVTFDQLSDGEQMLIGRVALMLLLQHQDQSLLLLDEPETHFNDVWKREIIDWLDEALLKDTRLQVVVATHTSIALTDVFAAEITRLVRQGDGRTVATGISMPTFGADPGRIMQNVFAAPDSIGARASELLDQWLKMPPTDQAMLEHLVRELGGGYHRAKLRGLLEDREGNEERILVFNEELKRREHEAEQQAEEEEITAEPQVEIQLEQEGESDVACD